LGFCQKRAVNRSAPLANQLAIANSSSQEEFLHPFNGGLDPSKRSMDSETHFAN
jgi:hypothetical protein